MKKNIVVAASVLILAAMSSITAQAQSETTATSLVRAQESSGSARYKALGGAMGAVGAEFSAVNQNPASIALLRRGSKVSVTGSYTSQQDKATWYGETIKSRDGRLGFDELSFMTTWGNSSRVGITTGFGLRNSGRFDRSMLAHANFGGVRTSSLADISAAHLNRLQFGRGDINLQDLPVIPHKDLDGLAAFGRRHLPWISILGYQAGWITSNSPNGGDYYSAFTYPEGGNFVTLSPNDAGMLINESGGMTDFDLAIGVRVGNIFNFGATLTMMYLNYDLNSRYTEGYNKTTNGRVHGLSLDNSISISGGGARLGLGVLVEPLQGLRLGASVYTPTILALKQDFQAQATGLSSIQAPNGRDFKSTTPGDGASSFELRTPWRFGLSGAYIFGHKGLISVDYEYSNLGSTELDEARDEFGYRPSKNNPFSSDNEAISEDYGATHTLRVGAEYNVTNRLALRAGFQSANQGYKNAHLERVDAPSVEVLTPNTQQFYTLPESTKAYSLGLGYKITPRWSIDAAFVYKTYNERIYTFSSMADLGPILDPGVRNANAKSIRSPYQVSNANIAKEVGANWIQAQKSIDYSRNSGQFLLTVGYRF